MRKVLPYPLTFLLSYVTFDSVIGPYLRQISSQIEILILLQWKISWKKNYTYIKNICNTFIWKKWQIRELKWTHWFPMYFQMHADISRWRKRCFIMPFYLLSYDIHLKLEESLYYFATDGSFTFRINKMLRNPLVCTVSVRYCKESINPVGIFVRIGPHYPQHNVKGD